MLQTLRNAWKIPDLRRKILYTIFLLIVFRFGSVIPVPWVDKAAIQTWLSGSQGSTLFDLLDTFGRIILTGNYLCNVYLTLHQQLHYYAAVVCSNPCS